MNYWTLLELSNLLVIEAVLDNVNIGFTYLFILLSTTFHRAYHYFLDNRTLCINIV